MSLSALPSAAAWRHRDARMGFEVVYFQTLDEGYRIDGYTTAIEDGEIWMVNYTIRIDTTWTTRRAQITGRSTCGLRQTVLEADGAGQWLVDGEVAPHLDGCLDVDLESSAMTNALPVRRMGLQVGDQAAAPAAYVGALDLAVERLEQDYVRAADESSHQRYDYTAPAFDVACLLLYDECGLLLDYPGIAVRAG
jgi:hypothetical protein